MLIPFSGIRRPGQLRTQPGSSTPQGDFIVDYATSSELYSLFSDAYLLAQVQQRWPTASTLPSIAQIQTQIGNVVRPIDFGDVPSVSSASLNGTTAVSAGNYANGGDIIAKPLKGFCLGRRPATGQPALPRALITAGMHARELAPPLAVARFFSELLINVVMGNLPRGPRNPIMHPSFFYQAGKHAIVDEVGNPVIHQQYSRDKNVRKKQAIHDSSISPDINSGVRIKEYPIPYSDLASILQELEIIVIPTCNPGGLDYVLAELPNGAETPLNHDLRLEWRKTRAPVNTDPNANAGVVGSADDSPFPVNMRPIGVDINRNADFAWDHTVYYTPDAAEANSASNNPYNFTDYQGWQANSEPETQAVVEALLQTVSPTPAGEAQLTLPGYDGFLFYLDVHSCAQAIFIPWATETISNIARVPTSSQNPQTPAQNGEVHSVRNVFFDELRDGVQALKFKDRGTPLLTGAVLGPARDNYQEFFPKNLFFTRARGQIFNLVKAHIEYFGKPMARAIEYAVAGKAPVNSHARMNRRCDYSVGQSTTLYTSSGSPSDYAFNLNLDDVPTLMDPTHNSANYENTGRRGPVIALTVEVGHVEDGGFRPCDAQQFHSEDGGYYTQNQYAKVERETFAALRHFLLRSISYVNYGTPPSANN